MFFHVVYIEHRLYATTVLETRQKSENSKRGLRSMEDTGVTFWLWMLYRGVQRVLWAHKRKRRFWLPWMFREGLPKGEITELSIE